jgi:hypothetical protein
MSDVLEETTSDIITADHVRRRVDDWVNRIEKLYSAIEGWLPVGWTADRHRYVRMDEIMMHRFDIGGRDLPVLNLIRGGKSQGYIEPRGLWIIGTNGRLDLVRFPQNYMLVDSAKNFAAPRWRIAPLSDRRDLKPFNRGRFRSILA